MICAATFRRLTVACLVASACMASGVGVIERVSAQESVDKEPLPISLDAAPQTVVVGQTVKLGGNSIAVPGSDGVTLTVHLPAGVRNPNGTVTDVLHAKLDEHSAYKVDYVPHFAGRYQVEALAPDRDGRAQGGFRAENPAALGKDLVDAPEQAMQDALDIAAAAEQKVRALPASPAKDDLLRQIDDFNGQLRETKGLIAQAAPHLPELVKMSADVRPDPKIVKDRDDLLDSLGKARDSHEQARKLLQKIQLGDVVCDNLEVVVEGFKLISVLLNLAAGGGVMNIAKGFVKDLGASLTSNAVSSAIGSDMGGFATGEATKNYDIVAKIKTDKVILKTGETQIDKVLNKPSLVSIANDIAGKAAEKVMGHYCEQFSGTVSGRMHARFFTLAGSLWWEYAFDIKGRLSLHYPKDAKGDSVRVKGRLEGYGYNFALWENALTAVSPELMSSTVQKKIYIMPFAPHDDGAMVFDQAYQVEGSVFSQVVTPNSFFFDVNGSLDSDKSLQLEIGAARRDMDAKARVFVIYLPVLSLSPTWEIYNMPYKPAHFVFERASDHGYTIPLHTEGSGDKAVIRGKQHFENARNTNEAKGEYKLDFEVCNPGC